MKEKQITPSEEVFVTNLKEIVTAARRYAYKSVNLAQVVSNWLIGKRVTEQEKQGQERAEYGKRIVQLVADELSREFGTGYSATNIKSFVRFYKVFPNLQIGQTASAQLLLSSQSATPLHGSEQLFQAKYLTFLPTKEQLIREIEEQKEIFRLQHEEEKEGNHGKI